jgi:hypothetical protein
VNHKEARDSRLTTQALQCLLILLGTDVVSVRIKREMTGISEEQWVEKSKGIAREEKKKVVIVKNDRK